MGKATKAGRKFGRNKRFCEQYAREMRHEKSHARRVIAHLMDHQTDGAALGYYRNLPPTVRDAFKLPQALRELG